MLRAQVALSGCKDTSFFRYFKHLRPSAGKLFHEYEVNGDYEAPESGEMVPLQAFALEEQHRKDGEDDQRHRFLYDLELHQRECAAVFAETHAVCRHLEAVFGQCYAPREQYHGVERSVARKDLHLLQLEVAVPCEGHEYVGYHQQRHRCNSVFHFGRKITQNRIAGLRFNQY